MATGTFFVPFGREPGGLLEFLELPATATEAEIGQRRAAKKNQINRDAKGKKAALAEELNQGAITQAEHDERQAKIDSEKTALLDRFNDLNNAYNAQKSQQRGAARQKRTLVAAGWVNLAGIEVSEELLLARRPLPRIDDDALATLTAEPPAPRSVADAGRWRVWRDLEPLREADRRWERVPSATRAYWEEKIAAWRTEIEEAAPRLAIAGAVKRRAQEYPHLAGGRSRVVKQLAATEVPDEARPRRRDAQPPATDILRKLLAAAFEERRSGGLPFDAPIDFDELLARLVAGESPPP